MSFDIVVLRPKQDERRMSRIDEASDAFPLGTPEEIRQQCDSVFPSIQWSSPRSGVYRDKEGFAVEFHIPDESRPCSLHLTLHFGPRWDAGEKAAFDHFLTSLHTSHGWQCFAVSDGSSLLLDET